MDCFLKFSVHCVANQCIINFGENEGQRGSLVQEQCKPTLLQRRTQVIPTNGLYDLRPNTIYFKLTMLTQGRGMKDLMYEFAMWNCNSCCQNVYKA